MTSPAKAGDANGAAPLAFWLLVVSAFILACFAEWRSEVAERDCVRWETVTVERRSLLIGSYLAPERRCTAEEPR